tara:strand:- start:23 stop:211 length:189 start_codon:yes stop_codon:yes gene_type:complete
MSEWKIMVLNKKVSRDWQFMEYVRAESSLQAVGRWRVSNPLKADILDELGVRLTAIMDGGGI